MRCADLEITDEGIAAHYSGLVKGLVVDRDTPSGQAGASGMVLHQTETLMRGAEGRARLAAETLDFAQSLAD